VTTFDALEQQSALEGRLLIVDGQQNSIVGQNYPDELPFAVVMKIACAGINAISADNWTEMAFRSGS
jgi:hypothetical protein